MTLPINQVVLGDCLEVMRGWPDKCVDLVLTDPPYGIGYSTSRGFASWDGKIDGDDTTEARDRGLSECARLCRGPIFCFGSWKIRPPDGTHTTIIWDKGAASGMGDLSIPFKQSFELIHIIGYGEWVGKRTEGVLHHNIVTWESAGRSHPMQKPESLIRDLISRVNADLILDPFAGSGTTLVAAKQLGRKYIGIEIEPKYVAICKERLKQEQLPL